MILLVDDEENYRELIAKVLTKAGYAVLQAADGMGALSLLERSNVDLVISDILMPVLNGYALVARLREKWPDMPVILMTGYYAAAVRLGDLKSVSLLYKPFDMPALVAEINRQLSP